MVVKSKKAPAANAPPVPEERKSLPINQEYERKAKEMIRQAIAEKGADYEKLRAGLAKMGVEISAGGLENKISRGGFSAAFLLQCMAALKLDLAPASKR